MNLRIVPPPHRTRELINALRIQMGRTQIERGCLKCDLSQDTGTPNVILYHEAWSTWEDLERHVRSERFSWILELMELSATTPDLSFNDVHETRGMDYVQKLRTSQAS